MVSEQYQASSWWEVDLLKGDEKGLYHAHLFSFTRLFINVFPALGRTTSLQLGSYSDSYTHVAADGQFSSIPHPDGSGHGP